MSKNLFREILLTIKVEYQSDKVYVKGVSLEDYSKELVVKYFYLFYEDGLIKNYRSLY